VESDEDRQKRRRLTTTQDLAELMVKFADDVELWVQYGIRPAFVPEELLLAAERITVAMRVTRHNDVAMRVTRYNDMPLSQLVVLLARLRDPDQVEVTAPQMRDMLKSHGHVVPLRAVSVALHRAASRGIFERPARGVYRLATQDPSSGRPGPERPAATPRAS